MYLGCEDFCRLTSLVLGVAVAAGAAGVGLELAGVDSAVRTALVLVFLAVAPPVAIAGLLRTLDGLMASPDWLLPAPPLSSSSP